MKSSVPIFGLLGGAGPLISAHFQYELLSRFQNQSGAVEDHDFPAIVSINQALSGVDQTGVASFDLAKMALKEHAHRAQKAGANRFIIICGSLHSVWEPDPSLSWINWIDHTVQGFKKKGQRKIGVVGSASSRQDQLFVKALEKEGLQTIELDANHQALSNQLIVWGMTGQFPQEAHFLVQKLERYMESQGADGVWWACTELSFLPKSWLSHYSVQSLDQMIDACFFSLEHS